MDLKLLTTHIILVLICTIAEFKVTVGHNVLAHNNRGNSQLQAQKKHSCDCHVRKRQQRLLGGKVIEGDEFPWIAALFGNGHLQCAGVIVTDRHAVTTAGCVSRHASEELKLAFGTRTIRAGNETYEVERDVSRIIIHERHSSVTLESDVALLEWDEPLQFSPTLRKACLADSKGKNYTGSMGDVAGWGYVSMAEGKPSKELRKVQVPILSNEECRAISRIYAMVTDSMICAGFMDGQFDTCQGDGGGPLQYEDENGNAEVIGIVSWGSRTCGSPASPTVYTRIASYVDWIRQYTESTDICLSP